MLQAANATLIEQELSIEFHWQTAGKIHDDIVVFVHLIDENGQLVKQADGYAFAGIYPMSFWPQNASVQDVRHILLGDSQNNNYQLYVGLYNRINGERLLATSQQGDVWQALS